MMVILMIQYQEFAFLIEHLLSTGTVKFPKENGFHDFIKMNNGYYNAHTTFDITNFIYGIHSENFVEALEMFSCFFHQPLFTEEAITSAINAVDQEFIISTSRDSARLYRLFQVFLNITYSNFGIGNSETLNVENIREKVIEFFKEKYDSCKMKSVIFHNEDIEDKIKKFFEFIPQISQNPNVKAVHNSIIGNFFPSLFSKEYTNKYILYESINDVHEMTIYIEIPHKLKTFKSKSIDYINYLINKNRISLVDHENGTINLGFSIKFDIVTTAKISYFFFTIRLTEEGYKKHEDVVGILYSYLCNLDVSLDTFINFIKINQNKFRYLENTESLNYYMELSNILHNVPYKFSINYSYICDYFDENEIIYVLDIMKNTYNWLVLISDQNKFVGNVACEKEKYYNFKYSISNQIDINIKNSSQKDLLINLFKNKNIKKIPVNLKDYSINKTLEQYNKKNKLKIKKQKMDVISLKKIANKFEKIDGDGKITYINDSVFNINTVYISILLNFEIKKEDYVKVLIYLDIMSQQYKIELKALFEISNVTVKANVNDRGIQFVFSGSSKKMLECIRKYIEIFKTPKIKNFMRLKSDLIDLYKNYKNQSPHDIVSCFLNHQIFTNRPYNDELLQYCHDIKESDIHLNHEYFIEIFAVSNNTYNHKLLEIYDELKKQFKPRNRYEFKGPLSILDHKFYTNIAKNNCVGIFINYEKNCTYKALAGLLIIRSHFAQKFFHDLRTKEQIGYIVSSYDNLINKKLFYNFVVVSTQDCKFLEKRILKFIEDMKIEIENFSVSEFDKLKQSALKVCDIRFINRSRYFNILLYLYYNYFCDLDYFEKLYETIKNFEKKDLVIPETKIIVHAYEKDTKMKNPMEESIHIISEKKRDITTDTNQDIAKTKKINITSDQERNITNVSKSDITTEKERDIGNAKEKDITKTMIIVVSLVIAIALIIVLAISIIKRKRTGNKN